jgi:hypothetical protein
MYATHNDQCPVSSQVVKIIVRKNLGKGRNIGMDMLCMYIDNALFQSPGLCAQSISLGEELFNVKKAICAIM